jgi:hypothetical protein
MRRKIATLTALAWIVLSFPARAYFPQLAPWAGVCAQSMGTAPGCGTIPQPRGMTPREREQLQQQQEELNRLQKEREAEEEQARKAKEADQAGQAAAARGDWVQAANLFIQALSLAPGDASIRAHLDRANVGLADMQTAGQIADLRRTIEDQILAANIAALRKSTEDELLAQRLKAFYESIAALANAAPVQAERRVVEPLSFAPFAPIRDPGEKSWADLESFLAPASLNPAILSVQNLKTDGIGPVNNDFYSVTIDANGQSAADVMRTLRLNLSDLVYARKWRKVRPYDDDNGAKWKSSSPQGAVMTFVLVDAALYRVRADVVVSHVSDTEWVFSTVRTGKNGWHPVCGNRAFGVSANADGSLTIWTKGADRAVDHGALWAQHQFAAGREFTFARGDDVWKALMQNLATHYAAGHPRDFVRISVRRPY